MQDDRAGSPSSRTESPGNGADLSATSAIKQAALSPESLLRHALDLYRTFNPAQLTLDSHADNALSELGISNHNDNVFIRQVLYGVVRYRQFLGSLMDSFYYYNRHVTGSHQYIPYEC